MHKELFPTMGSQDLSMQLQAVHGQSSFRKHKKKIVLSQRNQGHSPASDNKQNLQMNFLPVQISLKQETFKKEKRYETRRPFYLESSLCDYEQIQYSQSRQRKSCLRSIALDLRHTNERLIQGVKKLSNCLTKSSFLMLMALGEKRPRRWKVSGDQVQKMVTSIKRWGLRVGFGNVQRHLSQISQAEIQIAVEIIKKRDNELSKYSRQLSVKMLVITLKEIVLKLTRMPFQVVRKYGQERPAKSHAKHYSFAGAN